MGTWELPASHRGSAPGLERAVGARTRGRRGGVPGGVRPSIAVATGDVPPSISSPSKTDLGTLNDILARHDLQRAEPSILTAEEEADRAQTIALEQGVEVPNLGNFVTLHFRPTRILEWWRRSSAAYPKWSEPWRCRRPSHLRPPSRSHSWAPLIKSSSTLRPAWRISGTSSAADRPRMAACIWPELGDRRHRLGVPHHPSGAVVPPRSGHAFNSFDGGTNVSTGASVSHGTAVMGIAGGADNDLGMAGVGFGATLWPCKRTAGPGRRSGGTRGRSDRLGPNDRWWRVAQDHQSRGADRHVRELRDGAVGQCRDPYRDRERSRRVRRGGERGSGCRDG